MNENPTFWGKPLRLVELNSEASEQMFSLSSRNLTSAVISTNFEVTLARGKRQLSVPFFV